MQLTATGHERALQDEVRAFLAAERLDAGAISRARSTTGWRCCAAGRRAATRPATSAAPGPSEFGGGGRPPVEQIVVDQELAAAGAPEFVNVVGLDVLGPSLLRFGTDEQRRRYIPSILSAEEIWCQGFSEPEAGSDLASLRTRAVEHDDHFVLSGQKTWVSWGQYARWCGVLARTDETVAQAPRHLDADRRHALARRRGAPDDADHRPRRVLRALPRRRDRPQGEPPRRARRRLEDRDAHARPRARHRRAAAPGEAAHVAGPRGARRRRARRSTERRSSTTRRCRSRSRGR